MLTKLAALTGWSFVAACVFAVVAATVHGALDLVERLRQRSHSS